MKKLIYKMYSVLGIPALFIHELMHILALVFTLTRISKIIIKKNQNVIDVEILRGRGRTKLVETIISFSPFVAYFVVFLLCLFTPFALIPALYLMLFWMISKMFLIMML